MNDKPEKLTPLCFQLLRKFCPDHLYEEIEGDLIQKYNRDLKVHGSQKAKRKLNWNVIRFLRPGILMRQNFSVNLNQMPMFRNYVLTI